MIGLVGSGEYLPPMEAVDRELLALFESPPRVVCVPTAAGREGDAMIDDWMQRGIDHFTSLGAEADGARVWNRETAADDTLAERVADADFVYLSGGNPAYLYDTLIDTPVWAAITTVLDRGGLLVGCSAGAMIQGERFLGGITPRTGFGLWPGVLVIPHFDEMPRPATTTLRHTAGRNHTVVGVNGDTALVEVNGTYRVFGDEITIWSDAGRSTHGPGDVPAELFVS